MPAKTTKQKLFVRPRLPLFVGLAVCLIVGAIGAYILSRSFAGTKEIIREDFSITAGNFTTLAGGSWKIVSGQYRLTSPLETTTPTSYGNANYAMHKVPVTGDFTESVDFTVVGTASGYDDASLIFNWKDSGNYMFASFTEKANDFTNGIFKVVNNQQTRVAAFSAVVSPGVLQRAQVVRSGNAYTISVNGKVVGTATDSSFSGGRVGIGSRNNAVSFDNFVVSVPVDTVPPSMPTGLQRVWVTSSSIGVQWNASTDNKAVTGYDVYANGKRLATTASTNYTLSGLTPGATYAISVVAVDAAGNLSGPSAILSIATINKFMHPGVVVDKTQLDLVKSKIAAKAEPWTSAYNKTKSSRFASTSYAPHPTSVIDCTANNAGCSAEQEDAIAAYTQALLWYYTGNRAYAQTTVRILNAWAVTMKSSNGNQAHLNHAWAGEVFSRAAELIRYTYIPASGETALDVSAVSKMFTDVIMPQIVAGTPQANTSAGNWELSMTDAQMGIAIFTDNRELFTQAVSRWETRVKSYIYLTSDGDHPAFPPGSYDNNLARTTCKWALAVDSTTCTLPKNFDFMNGQVAETCRDMSHVILGLEAMTYGAETARIQGTDLYGKHKQRIMAGYEFSARWDMASLTGGAMPASLCSGKPLATGGTGYILGWEMAYNEYVTRRGGSMPYTKAMIQRLRPTGAVLHIDWETLTHGTSL
jgi:hypothetical protein